MTHLEFDHRARDPGPRNASVRLRAFGKSPAIQERKEALTNATSVMGPIDEFATVQKLQIIPDPGILKAIGLNHGFESAIADLVDNSIDAQANRVLVRFVIQGGIITRLLVIDDGSGMNGPEIDTAMQLGRPKEGSDSALGHFGIGLKAATFSQASVLTVLSRKIGCTAQGRRMRRDGGGGFECDVLDGSQIEVALDAPWPGLTTSHGTIIRWDSIRTFPKSSDLAVTNAFIEAKRGELCHHLGLMFHRLLESETIAISIDFLGVDDGAPGFRFDVEPIDPFGYPRSGAKGYPATLFAHLGVRSIPLRCHIWPGGSDSRLFKIAGRPVDQYQGFYMYRNNRLVSVGRWGGVVAETKRRKLARVSIDIESYVDVFAMSPEKSDVHMEADLVHAIAGASSDRGVTFQDYLAKAEETFQKSNTRPRQRVQILPPGQGMPPSVKKAIAREADIVRGEEPIRIRWTRMPRDEFIEVDRTQRILWLNSAYRTAVLKGAAGGINDAPLLKTLLFLLYEDIFHGTFLGPRDKERVHMWHEILRAAADAEATDFAGLP